MNDLVERFRISTLVLLLLLVVGISHAEVPPVDTPTAVLITGTSKGIGRRITERLAARGYFVYAGVRSESEIRSLNAIKNVQAIKLDVTSETDIAAAVDTVTKGGRGLYGLINNAGVVTYGNVADMKQQEFDLVMTVNVYGPFRVTQAFAPLIVAKKGRIVNIGSIAGLGTDLEAVEEGTGTGAYDMSKHAMEAFTDSLAAEMRPLGVRVSIIEPGSYRTSIERTAIKRLGGDPASIDNSGEKEPDEVARAAELALFEPQPKRRYLVVPEEAQAKASIKNLINQLVEVNEGQRYTYNRRTLVKMLDEALAGSRPRTVDMSVVR